MAPRSASASRSDAAATQRHLEVPRDQQPDVRFSKFYVTAASGTTVAAVLPLSRSVQAGGPPPTNLASGFAAIINAGMAVATRCRPAGPAVPPANLGTFTYQTTDVDNTLTGTPNTPANIAPGAIQNFVFGFTPTGAIPETSLAMRFQCDNVAAAPQIPGVNNFFIVAENSPVPDTIALMATISEDGVVRIAGPGAFQFFAVASSNVGVTGTITVSADTSAVPLPVSFLVCETDLGGNCIGPEASSVTVSYTGGTNKSFRFRAQASGSIPFDPALNRVFARFRDGSNILRGATSAALCTVPNPGC